VSGVRRPTKDTTQFPAGGSESPKTLSAPLVFELPLPDNVANGRMHWRAKATRKNAYMAGLDMLMFGEVLPGPPLIPLVKPVAEIEMRTVRRMDHDNAHARLKWVLDWLQTRGYMANDRDLKYHLDNKTAPRKDVGITLVLREAA
jgi:hypothetical protein